MAAPLDRIIQYYRGLDLVNVGAHQRITRSVNGVSGVLYHPGNRQPVTMAGTIWRVTLSPGSLADAIVHQIEAEVEDWARAGDPHPIPTDKLTLAPSGNGGTGISIGDVKAFARTGVTTPPSLPISPRLPCRAVYSGCGRPEGNFKLPGNQLSAGSPHFVLDTIPTPEQQAIGGLLPQGGVVAGARDGQSPDASYGYASRPPSRLCFFTPSAIPSWSREPMDICPLLRTSPDGSGWPVITFLRP